MRDGLTDTLSEAAVAFTDVLWARGYVLHSLPLSLPHVVALKWATYAGYEDRVAEFSKASVARWEELRREASAS